MTQQSPPSPIFLAHRSWVVSKPNGSNVDCCTTSSSRAGKPPILMDQRSANGKGVMGCDAQALIGAHLGGWEQQIFPYAPPLLNSMVSSSTVDDVAGESRTVATELVKAESRQVQCGKRRLVNSFESSEEICEAVPLDQQVISEGKGTCWSVSSEQTTVAGEEEGQLARRIPDFAGFRTASAKHITISAAAMRKAQSLFSNDLHGALDVDGTPKEHCDTPNCADQISQACVSRSLASINGGFTMQADTTISGARPFACVEQAEPSDQVKFGEAFVGFRSGAGKKLDVKVDMALATRLFGDDLPVVRLITASNETSGNGFCGAKSTNQLADEACSFAVTTPNVEVSKITCAAINSANGSEQAQLRTSRETTVKRPSGILKFGRPYKMPRRSLESGAASPSQRSGLGERCFASAVQPGFLSSRLNSVPRGSLISLRSVLANRFFDADAGKINQLLAFGVLRDTLHVSAASAVDFCFTSNYLDCLPRERFKEFGMLVGDGFLVKITEDDFGRRCLTADSFLDTKATSESGEPNRCNIIAQLLWGFLKCPGVDASLISSAWCRNHYRWIVWKLAALEVACASQLGGRWLTPDHVAFQLKYRYDVEIDCGKRSALKKILEQDESASRAMVLIVSSIGSEQEYCTIELSDGWYAVKTQLDSHLSALVNTGAISVGVKLFVVKAVLHGCDAGCSPLDAPANVRLAVHINGVRRARSWATLGFHRSKLPISFSVRSVKPAGGVVPCMKIIILRIFPLLYVERQADGTNVRRNERAELVARSQFDNERQKAQEFLWDEIVSQYAAVAPQRIAAATSIEKKANYTCDESQVKSDDAPSSSPSDVVAVQETMRVELQDRLLQRFPHLIERKVQAHMKMHVIGVLPADTREPQHTTVMFVKNPTDDHLQMLREGRGFYVFNVSAFSQRSGFASSQQSTELSVGLDSRYVQFEPSERDLCHIFTPRRVSEYSELTSNLPSVSTGFDVCVVGLVVDVVCNIDHNSGRQYGETVYLSNENVEQPEFVCVKFNQTLKAIFLDTVLVPGACVACANLQHMGGTTGRMPVLVANEYTFVSTRPRQDYFIDAFERLLRGLERYASDTDLVSDLRRQLRPWQQATRVTKVTPVLTTPSLGQEASVCGNTTPIRSHSDATRPIGVKPVQHSSMYKLVLSDKVNAQFKSPMRP